MSIGEKIKDLRVLNGLTQEELAERTELSKGFISQVERDYTSPSISTLKDILQILGTTLTDFFAEDTDEQVVFKSEDYFENKKNSITTEWIIPTAQKNEMEPIRVTLPSGKSTKYIQPSESEFFGYILSGSININLGRKTFSASKGESFYYKGSKKHNIESKDGATFIWISSPPIF